MSSDLVMGLTLLVPFALASAIDAIPWRVRDSIFWYCVLAVLLAAATQAAYTLLTGGGLYFAPLSD